MENNFAKAVTFEVKTKQIATMIINGVSQSKEFVNYVVMKCPHCGEVLTHYDDGVSMVSVYKDLANAHVSPQTQYCMYCGGKLTLDKSIVDEQIAEF